MMIIIGSRLVHFGKIADISTSSAHAAHCLRANKMQSVNSSHAVGRTKNVRIERNRKCPG
jgi:hypothetical protein